MAAIENAFFSPLWNDKESDKRDTEAIVQKLDMENELQKIFESKEKAQWLKQSSEDILNSSPSLSLEDIRNSVDYTQKKIYSHVFSQKNISINFNT